jgi:hypothetical protein
MKNDAGHVSIGWRVSRTGPWRLCIHLQTLEKKLLFWEISIVSGDRSAEAQTLRPHFFVPTDVKTIFTLQVKRRLQGWRCAHWQLHP